jgi:hypothetical protein
MGRNFVISSIHIYTTLYQLQCYDGGGEGGGLQQPVATLPRSDGLTESTKYFSRGIIWCPHRDSNRVPSQIHRSYNLLGLWYTGCNFRVPVNE